MIRQGLLAVLLLVIPVAVVAEEKKNPLEGKWKLKSVTSNDSDTTPDGVHLSFNATHAWLNDTKEQDRFKYKCDISTKPPLLDITTPDDKEIEGIWEVKGDTLRLCICSPQGVKFRPTEFHGRENQIFLILERVKE